MSKVINIKYDVATPLYLVSKKGISKVQVNRIQTLTTSTEETISYIVVDYCTKQTTTVNESELYDSWEAASERYEEQVNECSAHIIV